jgi:hypothetical protein
MSSPSRRERFKDAEGQALIEPKRGTPKRVARDERRADESGVAAALATVVQEAFAKELPARHGRMSSGAGAAAAPELKNSGQSRPVP